jgi:hypothetical protein
MPTARTNSGGTIARRNFYNRLRNGNRRLLNFGFPARRHGSITFAEKQPHAISWLIGKWRCIRDGAALGFPRF